MNETTVDTVGLNDLPKPEQAWKIRNDILTARFGPLLHQDITGQFSSNIRKILDNAGKEFQDDSGSTGVHFLVPAEDNDPNTAFIIQCERIPRGNEKIDIVRFNRLTKVVTGADPSWIIQLVRPEHRGESAGDERTIYLGSVTRDIQPNIVLDAQTQSAIQEQLGINTITANEAVNDAGQSALSEPRSLRESDENYLRLLKPVFDGKMNGLTAGQVRDFIDNIQNDVSLPEVIKKYQPQASITRELPRLPEPLPSPAGLKIGNSDVRAYKKSKAYNYGSTLALPVNEKDIFAVMDAHSDTALMELQNKKGANVITAGVLIDAEEKALEIGAPADKSALEIVQAMNSEVLAKKNENHVTTRAAHGEGVVVKVNKSESGFSAEIAKVGRGRVYVYDPSTQVLTLATQDDQQYLGVTESIEPQQINYNLGPGMRLVIMNPGAYSGLHRK